MKPLWNGGGKQSNTHTPYLVVNFRTVACGLANATPFRNLLLYTAGIRGVVVMISTTHRDPVGRDVHVSLPVLRAVDSTTLEVLLQPVNSWRKGVSERGEENAGQWNTIRRMR